MKVLVLNAKHSNMEFFKLTVARCDLLKKKIILSFALYLHRLLLRST